MSIDITTEIDEVNKSYKLASAFDAKPDFWQALRVLTDWARAAEVLEPKRRQPTLSVLSFCQLFITFFSSLPNGISYDTARSSYTKDRFENWMLSDCSPFVGAYIVEFFKFLTNRKDKTWISSNISKGSMDQLARKAEIALYILTLNDGNVKCLFEDRLSEKSKRLMSLRGPSSMTETHLRINNLAPLRLTPLLDAKQLSQVKREADKKSFRSSLFPEWTQSSESAIAVALKNSFKEIAFGQDEHCYIVVQFVWNRQDLEACLNSKGNILSIRQRHGQLIPEADCFVLAKIRSVYQKRSVLIPYFHEKIERSNDSRRMQFPFHHHVQLQDWIIKSMRRVVLKHKLSNDQGDVLLFNEVYDGIIQSSSGKFEWQPRRYEFQPRLTTRSQKENSKLLNVLKHRLYGYEKFVW